jgi:hypothetical protein
MEQSGKSPEQEGARRRRRAQPHNLTTQEQDRVDIAAEFCVDTIIDGWPEAVNSQVQKCLTRDTWNRLFGKRRQKDCKVLADIAKSLLDGKKALHDFVGSVASRLASWFGAHPVEQAVVNELAKHIPIPVVDEKTVVVARGLQMTGIVGAMEDWRIPSPAMLAAWAARAR